jgi:2-polyprenyl-6-methoxyphenol hydroxylase-like FAD-dependent oxidoreductase
MSPVGQSLAISSRKLGDCRHFASAACRSLLSISATGPIFVQSKKLCLVQQFLRGQRLAALETAIGQRHDLSNFLYVFHELIGWLAADASASRAWLELRFQPRLVFLSTATPASRRAALSFSYFEAKPKWRGLRGGSPLSICSSADSSLPRFPGP